MFRPPMTPGSSYYNSGNIHHQQLTVARKRQQVPDVSGPEDLLQKGDNIQRTSHTATPAPLGNSTYVLAGGHDTPSLAAAVHYDHPDARDDMFRGKWDQALDSPVMPGDLLRGPLSRERNGHSRLGIEQERSTGWSSYVFTLATNVAGKIVNFCRDGAFRGFHAGRGKGYDFSEPTQLDTDYIWDGYFRSSTSNTHLSKQRDFSGDFEQDDTRSRPAKRLHMDANNGWVFVQDDLDTRDSSPRLTERKTSHSLLTTNRSTATPANTRRSLIPVSRRTTSLISHTGSPSLPLTSTTASDLTKYERRASLAPTRSPTRHHTRSSSALGIGELPPLSPKAKKILAKRAREDRETDKSMSKMSKQLQDLIRQGRAALGTTVNVDELHDNDGSTEESNVDGWEDAGSDAVDRW